MITIDCEELLRAIAAFKRADDEYRRARSKGEQPRLSRAGTNYALKKWRLFRAAKLQRCPMLVLVGPDEGDVPR